jgi:hypothetical protein
MSADLESAADLTVKLMGTCIGGTGPDLTGYPLLTYAPAQWGPGIRLASNGAAVLSIALDAGSLMPDIDALAQSEGITLGELFESLLYARANGAI